MFAIHINPHTQNWIAETFNEGLTPLLGSEDPDANGQETYYLVHDGDTPNDIVTSEQYYNSEFAGGVLLTNKQN